MSKAKSVAITVILALIMAVAAFFAFVSFPITNKAERYNSILSNIHLGADYTGYAYTTLYPEGVYTAEEYQDFVEEYAETQEGTNPAEEYTKVGGLYVKNETYSDLTELKAQVEADAESLNARFGQKGYSSYSVAVEDGISIKISVPTNFSYAEYVENAEDSRSTTLSSATYTLSRLISSGELTLRTSDESIEDDSGTTYNMTSRGKDEWTDTATVTDSDDSSSTLKTYNLAQALTIDDVASCFKSISGGRIGSTAVITFRFTSEGREAFEKITALVANSSSKTLYFFVGDSQLVGYSECTDAIDSNKIQLQATDVDTAEDVAITMNSAVKGGALSLSYRDLESVIASGASYGDTAALLMFIACVVVFLIGAVVLTVKFKKLGALTSGIGFLFMLIEVYALYLLNIQTTFAVALTGLALIALYVISCIVVYKEVKKLTAGGRTMQAAIMDAYKNVIMTVSDIHIVLVIVAILLATVGVGEVAACGLLSVVGVVASYVLYWFTRLMWYVTSAPEKDKFGFAGLKRVVYEDD